MKTCYAQFDPTCGLLVVGNDKIEKVLRIQKNAYRTERITDKVRHVDWTGEINMWQRIPVLREGDEAVFSMSVEEQDHCRGIKPHKKAVLRCKGEQGTFDMEFMIFPNIPFVFSRALVTAGQVTDAQSEGEATLDCSGIEKDSLPLDGKSQFCDMDTLECIALGRRHLEVESICLFDKTDRNDVLVERHTTPVYSRGILERTGNIFCINDYPAGQTLMLVKHSPTPSSALNRIHPDLIMKEDRYVQLMGSGVDYSALPKGVVPCYASAVGVGPTSEIRQAYMQYIDAFEGTNSRRELFIMSNTWGDRSRDTRVCEEFILKELDRAHELGVDIMQIDDGWQSGVTANSGRATGGVWEGYYSYDNNFWHVDPSRFPNGLETIIKKAKECNVEVGLWFSPDSSHDFANVERDVETLMDLYRKYGVRHFKLDGIKVRNKICETRLIYLLDRVSELSDNHVQFNLDVTAEDRFGYLYQPQFGTLFVENRYSDWGNYYPHRTFKNVWDLSWVIPTRRLQMELLNIRRNRNKYQNMPFAPETYGMDYLFATVMVANPLVWAELTGLSNEDAALLGRMIAVYKPYQKELFSCRVTPIGQRPSGMNFSGFQCVSPDGKRGHLLLFRESTEKGAYTFELGTKIDPSALEVIYQSADATISADEEQVKANFSQPRSFVWMRYDMKS